MNYAIMSIPQLAQHLLDVRKREADFLYEQEQLQSSIKRTTTKVKAQTEYLRDLCKTHLALIELITEMEHA